MVSLFFLLGGSGGGGGGGGWEIKLKWAEREEAGRYQ
jgi:hypothetical protein